MTDYLDDTVRQQCKCSNRRLRQTIYTPTLHVVQKMLRLPNRGLLKSLLFKFSIGLHCTVYRLMDTDRVLLSCEKTL